MKKKLFSTLKDKCKDFGLSDKAIESLAELGSNGLTDESSEEDVIAKADSLVPFAKAMQGEITRKTKNKPEPSKPEPSKPEGDPEEGKSKADGEMPEWAKAMQASMQTLLAENAKLNAEKKVAERKASISAKAKELGIPEFMMKHYAIADDADIETELTAFKQELVTNNLLPKNAVSEKANLEATMKADAKAFAETLPSK